MKYWWNDKEVSVEEYNELNEKWKKYVQELELQEKNSKSKILEEEKPSRKNSKKIKK